MKKLILLLLILLIPVLALAQTAEDYYDRGATKGKLGDYRGAIQDSNKAIELSPNHANAHGTRGLAKISLGQKESDCLDLSKAGELGDMDAYDLIKKFCQ